MSNLLNKMTEIRALSEAAWEAAADTARDAASAAGFIDRWDAWGEHWDDAEQAIREGRVVAAIDHLELARRLEAESGDDYHARRATSLVQHGEEVVS